MHTGLIIKKLRESEGMLQEELASALNITRVYLSLLENGKKQGSLDILRQIAAHFSVPITLLLAWDSPSEEDAIYSKLKALYTQLLEAKIKSEKA